MVMHMRSSPTSNATLCCGTTHGRRKMTNDQVRVTCKLCVKHLERPYMYLERSTGATVLGIWADFMKQQYGGSTRREVGL